MLQNTDTNYQKLTKNGCHDGKKGGRTGEKISQT